MAMDKFYTLEDLKNTGLPMFDDTRYPDVESGTPYLKPRVISQWDFKNYDEYYTYYETIQGHLIKYVVDVCRKDENDVTACRKLLKDLSNINCFEV